MTPKEKNEFAELARRQMELVGENPEREGLLRTPTRVAEAMSFLTSGYNLNPETVLNDAPFEGAP